MRRFKVLADVLDRMRSPETSIMLKPDDRVIGTIKISKHISGSNYSATCLDSYSKSQLIVASENPLKRNCIYNVNGRLDINRQTLEAMLYLEEIENYSQSMK